MEQQRNYYAIIPANVRYDTELNPNAKLLYGEITALCNEKGYCWCNNDYFAKLYNVSKVSISKWINLLIQNGYIESEIIYKDGTKEILNRYLRIVKYPIKEKFNTPIKEKFKYNNTINNNTINKEKINKKELEKEFEEIWKLYPKKKGKSDSLKKYILVRTKGLKKETIIKGIENYNREIETTNKEYKYIKNGSTWFNQECWNDEYKIEKTVDEIWDEIRREEAEQKDE